MLQASIADTIQSAIERAGEAMLDTDGVEITTLPHASKWGIYADELRYMAEDWSDAYPLAVELSSLGPDTLSTVYAEISNSRLT